MRAFGLAPWSSRLNQLQQPRPVDVVLARAAVFDIAHFDGSPQRRSAPEIRRIDLGAVLNQQIGRVRLVVRDRHEQRTDFVGVGRFTFAPAAISIRAISV